MIDEYDFFEERYRGEDAGPAPEVRIEVVLTGLSDEARPRFHAHLRPWSSETNDFAAPTGDAVTDLVTGEWCPPVVFLGRFEPDEDDFAGNTFFADPRRAEWSSTPVSSAGG